MQRTIPKDILYHPQCYTLIDSDKSKIHDAGDAKATPVATRTIWLIGCADENKNQEKVVEFMEAEAAKNPPDFILMAGDNFNGVKDPADPKFQKFFHAFHQNKKYPNLREVPCLLGLGNHDLNAGKGKVDLDLAYAQVAHTFLDPATGEVDPKRIAIYQLEEKKSDAKVETKKIASSVKKLDLAALRKSGNNWNMPGRYGSYLIKEIDTEIFYCDSSSLVRDFISAFFTKEDKSEDNQARFLINNMPKCKAKNKILLLHHPLFSPCKRTVSSDHPDYLTPAEVATLEESGYIKKGEFFNYNMLLKKLLIGEEGPAEGFLMVSAHLHANMYFSNGDFQQVVAGGQGGSPQCRHSFDEHQHVGVFDKHHGFFSLTLSSERAPILKLHSMAGWEMVFNLDQGVRPVHQDAKKDPLRDMVISVCDEYQAHLQRNPRKPWTVPTWVPSAKVAGKALDTVPDNMDYADKLKNYFNQHALLQPLAATRFLKAALAKIAGFDHFRSYFSRELENRYRIRYYELINSPDDYVLREKVQLEDSAPVVSNNDSPLVTAYKRKAAEGVQAVSADATLITEHKVSAGGASQVVDVSAASSGSVGQPVTAGEMILSSVHSRLFCQNVQSEVSSASTVSLGFQAVKTS